MTTFVLFQQLEAFMVDVFKALGVPEADARTCADVLITSDKRGIDTHGVGRLKPIYTCGEKEHLAGLDREGKGAPIDEALQKQLIQMRDEQNLTQYKFPFE